MRASEEAKAERARNGPKKETGGNSKPDAAWIEEVLDAGELIAPEEALRPKDFLYDVMHQWQYSADELNVEFFESFLRPGQRRCNGTAYVRDQRGGYVVDCDWERITRPCLALPSRGTNVCRSHGSKIPAVKAAAERVLAHAAEVVALRLVGLTGTHDEVMEQIDHKVRLAAANSVLDRVGIKGGVTVEVEVPGYKKVLGDMFGEETSEEESEG